MVDKRTHFVYIDINGIIYGVGRRAKYLDHELTVENMNILSMRDGHIDFLLVGQDDNGERVEMRIRHRGEFEYIRIWEGDED